MPTFRIAKPTVVDEFWSTVQVINESLQLPEPPLGNENEFRRLAIDFNSSRNPSSPFYGLRGSSGWSSIHNIETCRKVSPCKILFPKKDVMRFRCNYWWAADKRYFTYLLKPPVQLMVIWRFLFLRFIKG
jgi:hypothetical protein